MNNEQGIMNNLELGRFFNLYRNFYRAVGKKVNHKVLKGRHKGTQKFVNPAEKEFFT